MSLIAHVLAGLSSQQVQAALLRDGKEIQRTDARPETDGAQMKYVADFSGSVPEFDEIAFFRGDTPLKSKKFKSETKSEHDRLSACYSINVTTGA